MKKIVIVTSLLVFLFTQQIAYSQCSNFVSQNPITTQTFTTNWQFVTGTQTGEYSLYSVTAGETYIWSLCAADGGDATYDSELTLYNETNVAAGNEIAFNDDSCGVQSVIKWTATFTGTVRIIITEYGCLTNAIPTVLAYQKLASPLDAGSISSDQTICSGGDPDAFITVAATGGINPITYTWEATNVVGCGSGWTPIPGATTEGLDIPAGYVTATICVRRSATDGVTTVYSNSVTITVSSSLTPAVVIVADNNLICAGSNVTFTATPTNGGTIPIYQWILNSGNVGSNSNTYSSTGLSAGDQISCIMTSNSSCANPVSATSNIITISVNSMAPTIQTMPVDSSVLSGNNASFSVSVIGTNITYQWQENNGGGWNNIIDGGIYSGASNGTLLLTGVTPANTGYQYQCVVSLCGLSTTSSSAILTVSAGGCGNFVSQNPLSTQMVTTAWQFISGTQAGQYSLYSVTAGETYIWSLCAADGGSSTYDTQLTLFNEANATAGNDIEFNDDGCANLKSKITWLATFTGTVRVLISEYDCISNTIPTILAFQKLGSVSLDPGSISGDQTLCSGDDPIVFGSVDASGGSGSITYQWESTTVANCASGWANIVNAISATYDVPVGIDSTTCYRRKASDASTSSYSNNVTITVTTSVASTISIAASTNSVCVGTSVTFTATSTNAGLAPTFQWQVNSMNIGSSSDIFTSSLLNDGDIVSCILTSTANCANPTQATSNTVTMAIFTTLTPSITIVASSNPICSGSTINFTATPVNGGGTPSYQWKKNGANVGINNAIYSTSLLTDGDIITCVLTSNSSCVSPLTATSNGITISISTSIVPSLVISTSYTNICSGSNTIFTAFPTNGGTTPSYQWQLNDSSVGSNSSTYSNSTLLDGDIITCVLTSSDGCASPSNALSNSLVMMVSNSVSPSITVSPSGNNICSGTPVTFTAIATNAGSFPLYQWLLNGVNIGSSNPTYTSSTLNNTDAISCVLTSNAACIDTTIASSNNTFMIVNPLLVPSLTINTGSTTICAGTTVVFTATPVNGGASPIYQWKVNGSTVGTNSASYSNSALINGSIITCVMTSNATCAAPATVTSNAVTMVVNPILLSSVSVFTSATTICSGTNVSFTANQTNGGSNPSYQWTLNGGNVGTNTPVYTNASLTNGSIVRCQLTSSAACATPPSINSLPVTITVNPVAQALVSITANSTIVCEGDTAVFIAIPTNGGSNPVYAWMLNGLSLGLNSTVIQISGLQNGDIITCVMNSSDSCATGSPVTSNSIAMTVNPLPLSSISPVYGLTWLCSGDSVLLMGNSGTGLSYQWVKDGVIILGATTQTYYASMAGNYTLMVTNSCGTASSIPYFVLINALPQIIQNPQDVNTCMGLSVAYSINATGSGLNYLWQVDNGSGWINIVNSPTYQGSSASTLHINNVGFALDNNDYRCEVSDSCGMTLYSVPAFLLVDTINPVTISANPLEQKVCDGDSAIFSISAGSAFAYQWQVSSNSSVSWTNINPVAPYHNVTSATLTIDSTDYIMNNYLYRCSVLGNCSQYYYSLPAYLRVGNVPPTPVLSQQHDTLVSSVGGSLQWFKNNLPIPGVNNSIYIPTTGGVYHVEVGGNIYCVTSKSNFVTVSGVENNEESLFEIYPNPTKGIISIRLNKQISSAEILVINLLGEIVASRKNNGNNLLNIDLSTMPDGIYYVKIKNNSKTYIHKLILQK